MTVACSTSQIHRTSSRRPARVAATGLALCCLALWSHVAGAGPPATTARSGQVDSGAPNRNTHQTKLSPQYASDSNSSIGTRVSQWAGDYGRAIENGGNMALRAALGDVKDLTAITGPRVAAGNRLRAKAAGWICGKVAEAVVFDCSDSEVASKVADKVTEGAAEWAANYAQSHPNRVASWGNPDPGYFKCLSVGGCFSSTAGASGGGVQVGGAYLAGLPSTSTTNLAAEECATAAKAFNNKWGTRIRRWYANDANISQQVSEEVSSDIKKVSQACPTAVLKSELANVNQYMSATAKRSEPPHAQRVYICHTTAQCIDAPIGEKVVHAADFRAAPIPNLSPP